MRIVYIRGNKVAPDPRTEKEINSLIKTGRYTFQVLALDRDEEYAPRREVLHLENGDVDITRFGIPAKWGGGIAKNLIPILKYQYLLLKWLITNRNEYDCFHICGLPTGLLVSIVRVIYSKKMIYDVYDYYADLRVRSKPLYKVLRWLENIIISRADGTIICSEKRIEQIKGSKPKHLTIVHNTPEKIITTELSNDIESRTSRYKIAYIGCLIHDRYIIELIESMRVLKNCELHIGGFGVLEDYVRLEASKSENVFFYGVVPYSESLKIASECDIMIALYDPNVPNHKYAAPNKFYEALMLGKPLIMIKHTGMDDILEKNDIGAVMDLSQGIFQDVFCDAINNLILRRDDWKSMSYRMKEIYNNEYSWAVMERRLIELYDAIKNE